MQLQPQARQNSTRSGATSCSLVQQRTQTTKCHKCSPVAERSVLHNGVVDALANGNGEVCRQRPGGRRPHRQGQPSGGPHVGLQRRRRFLHLSMQRARMFQQISGVAFSKNWYCHVHVRTSTPHPMRRNAPPPPPRARLVFQPRHLKGGVHRGARVPRRVLQLGLRQGRTAGRRPVHRLPSSEDVPLREHLAEHLPPPLQNSQVRWWQREEGVR